MVDQNIIDITDIYTLITFFVINFYKRSWCGFIIPLWMGILTTLTIKMIRQIKIYTSNIFLFVWEKCDFTHNHTLCSKPYIDFNSKAYAVTLCLSKTYHRYLYGDCTMNSLLLWLLSVLCMIVLLHYWWVIFHHFDNSFNTTNQT